MPAPRPLRLAPEWDDRFGRMLLVAVGLSVVESVVGLYLSFYGNWASGATIVLLETAVFGVALVISPRRASILV